MASDNDSKLVVRHYSVKRQRKIAALVVAGFVAIFLLGIVLGGQWFESEMRAKRGLTFELEQLQQAQVTLQQQLINAETAGEIDRAALEQVRKTVVELQGQLADNREELKLYRNLMQDKSLSGLSVGELSLTSLGGSDVAYRLVLLNRAAALKPIAVKLGMNVDGVLNGEVASISLDQLDEQQKSYPAKLAFKYFGVVQGILRLPDGFAPETVRTELWQNGQRSSVKESFRWQLEDN
jgi:hypothetical protein